jgi:hypothetical protein
MTGKGREKSRAHVAGGGEAEDVGVCRSALIIILDHSTVYVP